MTIASVTLNGHPDGTFTDKAKKNAAGEVHSSALLTEKVVALAASLGVPTPEGNTAYEPDAFIEALQDRHDKLCEVARRLQAQHDEQMERARVLDRREAEVAFREKRATAHEQLKDNKRWRLW
jgi:hypothetical protein